VQTTLRAFQQAVDDETRQRLITRAGFHTLSLSLLLFVTLIVACAVVALPLLWIAMGRGDLAGYMVTLSVAALVWWRLRRRR
jgi:pilus assembly protein TadC